MNDKVFIDANLFVYAQDRRDLAKHEQSRTIISQLGVSGLGVVSTQVMQEFYSAATRKLGVSSISAKAVLKGFKAFEVVQVTPEIIFEAVDCSVVNSISFWDALIVSAAAAAGCTTLLTEDLNQGQTILGVGIQNPFTTKPKAKR